MWRRFMPALAIAAVTACGNKSQPAAPIQLSSDAFHNGGPIPPRYTCDGGHQRPVLNWSDPPPGTKSFALIVDDPDAPGGTFRHWGAYDIPANLRTFGAGVLPGHSAISDVDKPGYFGPCPPKGDKPHHYRFKLYALDVSSLDVGTDYSIKNVETAALKHITGRAELIGTYQRR